MKLATKVLLAFTTIIGIALLAVSLLIGRFTTDAYEGYLSGFQQRRLEELAAGAGAIHAETGSWTAVEEWLNDQLATGAMMPGMSGAMHGQGRGRQQSMQEQMRSTIAITDPEGSKYIGTPPAAAFRPAASVPIVANGAVIGNLAVSPSMMAIGSAEQTVLARVYRAIFWSALIAGLVALAMGGLLLNSILRPLRRLDAGVAAIANGDYAARVTPESDDEIGRLASNFNAMAGGLERQEALRQRMVADIAHELRTPLSVVQGNLQAILDGVFPLTQEEIETIYGETQLLSRLVSDLHELAQADAGHLPLTLQPVDGRAALEHTADSFRAVARTRGIKLLVADGPPALVKADPDRLQQILNNLVGNALRHETDDGLLTLALQPGPTEARFSVNNQSGIIAPADLPAVFDRFYRADPSRRRDELTTGAGLGLSIVKALVEAHGGRVGVESSAKQGTTFWFELPTVAD